MFILAVLDKQIATPGSKKWAPGQWPPHARECIRNFVTTCLAPGPSGLGAAHRGRKARRYVGGHIGATQAGIPKGWGLERAQVGGPHPPPGPGCTTRERRRGVQVGLVTLQGRLALRLKRPGKINWAMTGITRKTPKTAILTHKIGEKSSFPLKMPLMHITGICEKYVC
jgi:hypothetical protein